MKMMLFFAQDALAADQVGADHVDADHVDADQVGADYVDHHHPHDGVCLKQLL